MEYAEIIKGISDFIVKVGVAYMSLNIVYATYVWIKSGFKDMSMIYVSILFALVILLLVL